MFYLKSGLALSSGKGAYVHCMRFLSDVLMKSREHLFLLEEVERRSAWNILEEVFQAYTV